MATSTYGTPYVESGDLVSNWPLTSQSVADRVDDVSIKGNGVNTQTGTTYTTVLTDAGKTVTLDNAAAVAVTIPPNASVAYETGTQIKFLNLGAGTVTLGPGSGVTLNGDTLDAAQYVGLAAIKIDTDEWVVLPFSGGVGSAQISDTPTGSYTGYEYWTYTASGTLTVTKAGFADVLVVGGAGGGGGNNGGGGGAGGLLYATNAYLSATSHTVVVGAGGAGLASNGGYNGVSSRLASFYGVGGGGGGGNNDATAGQAGGSGGGGTTNAGAGGAGTSGQGNDGGLAASIHGGGGGGAGGAGASGAVSGAGGAGLANSITGSSVTYATGGDSDRIAGVTPAAGGANTGDGGDGSDGGPTAGGNGGSGIVIVRVAV